MKQWFLNIWNAQSNKKALDRSIEEAHELMKIKLQLESKVNQLHSDIVQAAQVVVQKNKEISDKTNANLILEATIKLLQQK